MNGTGYALLYIAFTMIMVVSGRTPVPMIPIHLSVAEHELIRGVLTTRVVLCIKYQSTGNSAVMANREDKIVKETNVQE